MNMNSYQHPTPYGTIKTPPMNILKFILIPTKKQYQPIAVRTYQMSTTNRDYNNVENMIRNTVGSNRSSFSDVEIMANVPTMLKLNPLPQYDASIPYGWQTQRFRFLLVVEHYVGSTSIVEYIQGFSEYYDVSFTQKIDPNMRFYINSISSIKRVRSMTNNSYNTQVYNNYNVLSNYDNPTPYAETVDKVMIRPADVLNSIVADAKYGLNDMGESNYFSTHNRVNQFSFSASRRDNNNPIKYMKKTLDGIVSSALDVTEGLSHDLTDIVSQAGFKTAEPILESSGFLRELQNVIEGLSTTHFTLNQLHRLDPTLEQTNRLIVINDTLTVPTYQTFLDSDDTESAIQPTDSNIKAATVANMIPSIMLDCLIARVGFSLTNYLGEPEIAITNISPFTGMEDINMASYGNLFANKIRETVYPILSNMGLQTVELHVNCDILGDISIWLNLDQVGGILYRFPVYADTTFSPVITTEMNAANFKLDLHNLVDSASTVLDRTSVYQTNGYTPPMIMQPEYPTII